MLVRWVCLLVAGLLTAPVPAEVGTGAADAPRSADVAHSDAEREELARILAIARQANAAVRDFSFELDVSRHPSIGATYAPLAIVEFGSYQCGYCRRHYARTMPQIVSDYVDAGQLRYVFFDFALDPLHAAAAAAAVAAHCAHEQGGFWPYRGQLFDSTRLSADALLEHAVNAGLDPGAFGQCLDSGRHDAQPQADRELSRRLRVRGTPSFFIGELRDDGRSVRIQKRIAGARPFAFFAEQIGPMLAAARPDATPRSQARKDIEGDMDSEPIAVYGDGRLPARPSAEQIRRVD
jgi:protein-disulfide isomerase